MAKKTKIYCCEGCGRDTKRLSCLCHQCSSGKSLSHEEEIGRPALSLNYLTGAEGMEFGRAEETPQLKYDLRKEDYPEL